MGCYCSEIPRCERDIETIQNIQQKLIGMSMRNLTILTQQVLLSGVSAAAITPDNIGSLQDALQKMNVPITENVTDMLTLCSNKISSLQIELSSMRASDRAHHESEKND